MRSERIPIFFTTIRGRLMKTNTEIVRENLLAFNALDYDRITEDYADNAIVHFVMREPITGKGNIRALFSSFEDDIQECNIRILNILESGDLVMVERVDDVLFQGKPTSIPVMCTVEMKEGKFVHWREYYDEETFQKQMQA
jgi:limonene-1,2-epoxide hydrolase